MSKLYAGIDLGTTNSTVSVIQIDDENKDNPIEKLHSIPIFQLDKDFNEIKDQYTLPSYFYYKPEKNHIYTGEWAKHMYSEGNKSLNAFTGIKTRIGGESFVYIPGKNKDDGTVLDMTQCSAILLKTIKKSIELQFDQKIDHLTVTVPAAFNSDERQATKDAIKMAGFEDFHILDEPAATLLYFINNGDGSLYENSMDINNKNVLVYDIGGGTLDICIAHIEGLKNDDKSEKLRVDIKSRSKREDLGGNNFDRYLGAYFLSEFEKMTKKINTRTPEEQSKIIARVVSEAGKYKIEFNDKVKELIGKPQKLNKYIMYPEFEVIDGQFVQGINLDKRTLEEVYSRLLKDSDKQNILRPVKDCIWSADNLEKDDISMIILTGGMSNFYAIEDTLKEYFGSDIPVISVDTETSVSKGAAIDSYNYFAKNNSLKKMNLNDRLSEDIFLRTPEGFKKLISRDDISKEKKGKFKYTINKENLTSIPIFLFYGIDPKHKEEFTAISGKIIDLPRKYDVGEKIDLNWNINSDAVISISMDGSDEELKVNNHSSKEISAKREIIDNMIIN